MLTLSLPAEPCPDVGRPRLQDMRVHIRPSKLTDKNVVEHRKIIETPTKWSSSEFGVEEVYIHAQESMRAYHVRLGIMHTCDARNTPCHVIHVHGVHAH